MQVLWWHQWQLNGHCKSLVGINDNLLNNLPLCHWWQHSCNYSCSIKIILPFSLSFSPPLVSMTKGIHMSVFMWVHCLLLHLPTYCLLPLSSCCACSPCHDALSTLSPPLSLKAKGIPPDVFHIWPFGEGITLNFCLRYSNVSLGRGLVKMSAICSFISTYSSLMFFSVTCSLRKWNLMGMCFVLEFITGFFGYIYCSGVVTKYWNGLIILHLNVFQCLSHLDDLCATCYCCNIFCFCCW